VVGRISILNVTVDIPVTSLVLFSSFDSIIRSLNLRNPAVWFKELTASSQFCKGILDLIAYEKF
jgi:hypothetical protein